MADIYQDIYAAGQNCINTQFCADGGSFDSSNISLPRTLKIRIIANPDYWGFGSVSGNTLIEGWGNFTNGKFDFFDGFDEDHKSTKTCGNTTTGPYINEQRPDVAYRSVYDPENGHAHYNGSSEDGIVRGGAESYLIDRSPSQTSDGASCDTTDPTNIFKTNPAGYGSYPKILFNNKIYKNVTGAWRINECSGCYDQPQVTNDIRVVDCSGSPKQHIQGDEQFSNLYDPFQNRCLASGYTSESGCQADGQVASQYSGSGDSIVRDTGLSPFLEFTLNYNNVGASGIFNGQLLGIDGSQDEDGVITAFDVEHQASGTTFKAVGTVGTTNYSDSGGFTWTAFNTYDPSTCCGGAAYGIDDESKRLTNTPLYHIDIGRVFNNPKNVLYSNRIDRSYNGITVDREVPNGVARRDYSYVAINESGHALLVASGAVNEITLACTTGVWDATATHIYELNGTYSTQSGVGSTALSTESGFYPLFPKELPYFGHFYETDRWDNNIRSSQGGNRQVNRNTTCYTKNGSLEVFPDCLSQWTQYTSCDPQTKYTLNNVARLGIVYKGCDFEDPCTFDDSGRPWTAGASGHPSSMNDLIRGFGGQEIQMFINLGNARAAEIKREPCCCEPPPCPGTRPPEFVEVPSPISYPCFPKFDLYPEQYGCQDPIYYLEVMNALGLDTDTSGGCTLPYYDACTPIQPYTTYGYIRNLCGKETNSRRGVIDSLSTNLHTGDYQDIAHTDDTVEPMYVAFEQDDPDCCSPSGFPTGSTECDPGLIDHTTYGTGASGEVVIDSGGGFTFNVTSAGSGYIFGGGVLTTVSTIFPDQTYTLTFGAANNGLSAISSTPGSGTPFSTTVPLTIVAGGSGVAGSGGFSYNSCSSQGTVHYWGLTDFQGRLAMPYFRTQASTTTICSSEVGPYIDFNESGTISNGWPKDKVPFLVEIDHEEYCSSCSTTQMPTGNLNLTIESLKGEYLHGLSSASNSSDFAIYGYTHNEFPGISVTPIYDAATDTWTEDFCESSDALSYKYGQGNTGETCECCSGTSVTMVPRFLEGTNTPIAYTTSGSVSNDGKVNSYFPFGNCGGSGYVGFEDLGVHTNGVMPNHVVYMKASMSCISFYSSAWYDSLYGSDGLDAIYGCSTNCATSFPAVNSTPDLDLDFYFVDADQAEIFEALDDITIYNNADFLKNGLIFTPTVDNWGFRSDIVCGAETGTFTTFYTNPSGSCSEIDSVSPDSREDFLLFSHCQNGNKGKMTAAVNISPCLGSRIVVYSCSWWNKGVYNRYHGNSDGKFGGSCDSAVGSYPTTEPEKSQGQVDGCQTVQPWATGAAFSDPCFLSRSSDFIPEVKAALQAYIDGDISTYANMVWGCTPRDVTRCCGNFSGDSNQIIGPFLPSNTETPYSADTDFKGCECQGFDNMDIAYDVTYSELTHPVTSSVTQGWYGDVLFPIVNPGNCDNQLIQYYWSGENIPGIGNIGPLPLGKAIAIHYSDTDEIPADDGAYNEIQVENFCEYHTGPNKYSNVGAEVFTPNRPSNIVDGAPNLNPELCTGVSLTTEYYGNCGTPAPFDTYVSGKGVSYTSNAVTESVSIVRKSVWPEIMTVHKIECESSGYKLHVSREYFEHDRTWYTIGAGAGGPTVVTRLGLIEGGEDSYERTCEETYLECLDPGTGNAPTILDVPFSLKMITPTDVVGPIYPELCATGTEIFYKTDASATFGSHTTSDTYSTGCLYYPNVSGQQFWNFYNLFYDSGDPTSAYLSEAGAGSYELPPDPDLSCNPSFPHNLVQITGNDLDPVFSSISEMRTNPHSCIQDLNECGGMFWNNKEFFPRKSYAVDTRITAFGALSICEQNAQLESPSWYGGHTTATWNASPNKAELAGGRFIDACDNSASVLARSAVGIDDSFIHIPFFNEDGSSPSILSLMGVIHPGFTRNVNQKTCIYADSGECLDFLPEHNDTTIRDITFTPDDYGYYLDKLVASGSDDCLFTPFKIMVDVECCPDRIGHKGTSDPTNLNYVAKIPASTCEGWIYDPMCTCNETFTSCYPDTGPLLPTLSCMSAILLHTVDTYDSCYVECVVETGDFANLQQYPIRELQAGPSLWLYDPNGGDPVDLLTLSSSGEYYTGSSGCPEECEIIDISGNPALTYNWNDASLTSGDIWSFEGNEYITTQAVSYFDYFEYNGVKYRFPNYEPGNNVHCCNPSGTIGIGTLSATSGTNDGCNCLWNFCGDMLDSIPMSTGAIAHEFPEPLYIPSGEASETGTDIASYHELMDHFGCKDYESARMGYYPSIVKLTITEDI